MTSSQLDFRSLLPNQNWTNVFGAFYGGGGLYSSMQTSALRPNSDDRGWDRTSPSTSTHAEVNAAHRRRCTISRRCEVPTSSLWFAFARCRLVGRSTSKSADLAIAGESLGIQVPTIRAAGQKDDEDSSEEVRSFDEQNPDHSTLLEDLFDGPRRG